MRQKRILFIAAVLLLYAGAAYPAGRMFVSTHLSYVDQNEDGMGSRTGLGTSLGYRFPVPLTAGFYAHNSGYVRDGLFPQIKYGDIFLMGFVDYSIPGIMPGSPYVGIRYGYALRSVKGLYGEDDSVDSFASSYGVEAGYEFKVLPMLTAGASVSYLYAGSAVNERIEDKKTITTEFDDTSYIDINLFTRFWF